MEQQTEVRGKFPWTTEEDGRLRDYVIKNGARYWDAMARKLHMGRSGNSCRLRWLNYLSPDIRRGEFTDEEMLLILTLHHELGNRWSRIAQQLPGRTDNDIKNFWNTRVKKEAKRLNCDVESDEFRHIMTARLTERVLASSLSTPAEPGGTSVASFSSGSSSHSIDWAADEELMSDDHTLMVLAHAGGNTSAASFSTGSSSDHDIDWAADEELMSDDHTLINGDQEYYCTSDELNEDHQVMFIDWGADQELMSDHQTLNVDDHECTNDEIWDHECTNDEYWARLGEYI
ncbi:hypothetical protein ACS0TY_022832 [Phlomoides rotata]